MLGPPGRVLSSGTWSMPQAALIDASRSGCSRRQSLSAIRPPPSAPATAAPGHRQPKAAALNTLTNNSLPKALESESSPQTPHANLRFPAIVGDSPPREARELVDLRPGSSLTCGLMIQDTGVCHERDSRSRCNCQRCRRLAIHFLLPHARFHPRHGACLRHGAEPCPPATPSHRFSPIHACAPKVIGPFARTPASWWCS